MSTVRRTESGRTPYPKFLNARRAAKVYGVHHDFFRKTPELRRHRIELTKKTHLYPVAVLDKFFAERATD